MSGIFQHVMFDYRKVLLWLVVSNMFFISLVYGIILSID